MHVARLIIGEPAPGVRLLDVLECDLDGSSLGANVLRRVCRTRKRNLACDSSVVSELRPSPAASVQIA